MNKAERLLKILTILQSRRRVITARALAERLNVSERTIYRDIQSLSQTGIDIEGEAGVGYMLTPGSLLPPISFEENELESLILGVRMVQGWGDKELGRAANQALEKIRAVLPERLHYLQSIAHETLLVPEYQRDNIGRFNATLRHAINRHLKVSIRYRKESGDSSERTIWPLGLVFWGKVWTLVTWCELRNDYRIFRTDRIQSLAASEEKFTTHPELSLQHYLENCVDK